MSVIPANDLIRVALIRIGADGLCNPDHECGCGIDDLAPGLEGCLNLDECQAAKWTKPKKDDPDYWEEFEDGYFKVME